LLWNRGLTDPDSARAWLAAEHEPLADPSLLAGLPSAVARIHRAIVADELIAVYGDYDVDGLSGTALLCRALRRLGARVTPFIPHREVDGYGLNDRRLAELRTAGASLLITVDCGVSAVAEVATARANGLEVIVTDHHPAPQELPEAIVINPSRADCAYPYKHLAGVGVAFRLAEALLRHRLPPQDAEEVVEELTELAALGTLADVMRVDGENRAIIRRGLARLRRSPSMGLRALLAVAGVEPSGVDSRTVGFSIAPRLNAAGRLDDARLALELLLADEPERARELALGLDELNRASQRQTDAALAVARDGLAGRELGAAIVIVGEFPSGIAGLLAGRLAAELNRPVVALARVGETCRGSARSVDGLDVVAAMSRGAAVLERFGGHAMAAGLALRAEHVEAFERAFGAAVSEARGAAAAERLLQIDAELRPFTAADWQTLEVLEQLEPCGPGSPAPVFLTRGLQVAERRAGGRGLIRLKLLGQGVSLVVRAFSGAAAPPLHARVDLVYQLRRNVWRGTVGAEIEALDWRLAAS
jgi:single-stranded-DNA-specific exonuclease